MKDPFCLVQSGFFGLVALNSLSFTTMKFSLKQLLFGLISTLFAVAPLHSAFAQETVDSTKTAPDTLPPVINTDTVLRIKNLNPYFTLHVDSLMAYDLEINREEKRFYYYMRNSPIGLKINKDNGTITFKAEKNFFLSGKLQYDQEYKVFIGVQNLDDPKEKLDTFFSVLFYNTEILPSRVKPTISSTVTIEESDTVSFRVMCENGNFPIESISFYSNIPLRNVPFVRHCEDEFWWNPAFDFVKESDSGRVKIVYLNFVGINRFGVRDTATVKVIVKDALNYPVALEDNLITVRSINSYILQLKYTFLQLDYSVKNTKKTRTVFDITSSTTALTGSILSSSTDADTKKTGQVLPSVGVSLVPIKEAVAPQKVFDQNQASLIRTAIKRLEYMVRDNALVGEKDPEILRKTNKLKDELKQTQIQLIDVPLELASNKSEEELNTYFNSPKVNKKYRIKK